MVVPTSSTSIAMAQTPGPWVTKCEWAKPSGSQLTTSSIRPCDQRSTSLLRWEPVLRKPSWPNSVDRFFALAGETAKMPAPGQHVETEPRRVRELDQENLVRWNRFDRRHRKGWRQRVKAVEDDSDRFVIGAARDFPGVAVVADMTSPGQRLEADAQAARAGQFAELPEIRRGAINAAERGRRNIAADQQQIGLQFGHQVEFALGSCEVSGALRFGHAFEIAKRLEC